jgi:hypothetical protein
MHQKRTKVWIDRFQTLLYFRIALYILLSQVAICFLVVAERHIYLVLGTALGPAGARFSLVFLAASVLLLGVLFLYDVVQFAHRLVGPVQRFRRVIKAITAGEELELLRLRQGDFLQDMKDEINEMLKALDQRGAVVLANAGATPEEKPALAVWPAAGAGLAAEKKTG